MIRSCLFALLALSACSTGPSESVGLPMSRDEISEEVIDQRLRIRFSEGGPVYDLRLASDGTIFLRDGRDSGRWFLSDPSSTDICLQFVIYAGGSVGCFGINRLPDPGFFATDHGGLIQLIS